MDLFYPQSYAHNSGEEEDVTRCIIDGQVGDPSKDFGWPAWSKNNCEYYTNSLYTSTCSVLQSVGLPHIYFADEDKLSMQTKNNLVNMYLTKIDKMLQFWSH